MGVGERGARGRGGARFLSFFQRGCFRGLRGDFVLFVSGSPDWTVCRTATMMVVVVVFVSCGWDCGYWKGFRAVGSTYILYTPRT